MKAWLIYTRQDALQNESYIAWFLEEARKQQVDMELIYRDELHISVQYGTYTLEKNGEVVDTPDFVVVRTIEPIIQKHFEAMAIPTFNNSEVATICNHKARTYIELNQLGITIMPSYFFTKDSLPTTPPVPFHLVVKSATGRGVNEVYMIHNQTEWVSCISTIQAYEVIIQATSHLQLGKDVRVFVIGKEIIAAVLRHNLHD